VSSTCSSDCFSYLESAEDEVVKASHEDSMVIEDQHLTTLHGETIPVLSFWDRGPSRSWRKAHWLMGRSTWK